MVCHLLRAETEGRAVHFARVVGHCAHQHLAAGGHLVREGLGVLVTGLGVDRYERSSVPGHGKLGVLAVPGLGQLEEVELADLDGAGVGARRTKVEEAGVLGGLRAKIGCEAIVRAEAIYCLLCALDAGGLREARQENEIERLPTQRNEDATAAGGQVADEAGRELLEPGVHLGAVEARSDVLLLGLLPKCVPKVRVISAGRFCL
mmetsp:Transcript_13390/g.42689  ORF Transcript_13390/g.42689 Transcript_13390/m.42689 type:complete len:205 (+) Transcript_13390:182-796(+)